MNLFKCLCLGIVAILLCGCGESRAEFDALNAGKINVVYENQTLKIAESTNFVILSVSEESQKKNNRDSSPTAQNDNLKKIAESRADSAPQNFILFFFTSTCGVCKAQIPILEQLSAQGIKIYAILGDMPDISKASAFASAHKISLPLFYESSAKRFFSQIVGGVKGVPVVVVFDKNGRMKERFIGLTPKGILKSAL